MLPCWDEQTKTAISKINDFFYPLNDSGQNSTVINVTFIVHLPRPHPPL